MEIKNVLDESFRKYGKVLKGYDFSSLLRAMRHTPVPEDVVYVPSCEEMESLEDLAVCPFRLDTATDIIKN